jgi:serine/threonine protein kinase
MTTPLTTRLALSPDGLTSVDLVRAADAPSLVDKHTLMTSDKAAASAALKELDVLLSLQKAAASSSSHVVALHSFRLDAPTQRLHILLEHCARGDLFHVAQDESRLVHAQLLAPHHGLTTCERALRRLAFQTLRGLRTLHRHGIAHMDLSLENVFLTATGDVRLGDFALAHRFQRDEHGRVLRSQQAPHVAKPAYAAPELFAASRSGVADVTKADVWSLGVLLWHLLARSPLFPTGAPTLQDPVFRAMLHSKTWADRLAPSASPAMRELLVALLEPNASKRLSVDAAMGHAWFTGRQATKSVLVAPTKRSSLTESPTSPTTPKDGQHKAVGRRGRTGSAEISLEATRVAIRPSRLRR